MRRNVRVALRALVTAYGALLVGPMLPLVVPGPEWPLFAASALVGAAGGYALTRSADPSRLFTRWRLAAAVFLPLPYFLAVFPAVRAEGVHGLLVPASLGVLACVPAYLALLLEVAAERRHDPAENPPLYRFEARLAPAVRRRIVAGSVLLVVGALGVGLFLTTVDTGAHPGLGLMTAAVASLVGIAAVTRGRREVVVTEAGLVVQGRTYRWEQFDGFSVDQERLALHSSEWWRADHQFDTADLEAPRTAVRALSRFLERTD